MKSSLLILLVVALVSYSAFGQSNKKEPADFDIKGFKPFPKVDKFIDKGFLLSRIIPDSAYAYWEYVKGYDNCEGEKHSYEVIASRGDSVNYAAVVRQVQKKPKNGLFGQECHSPLRCYSYIVGVKNTGTVDVIDNFGKLKTLMGNVSNVEEIMLYAFINGYGIDTDTIIGGAYKERKNDYLLYLSEFNSTPVTNRSVKAILTRSGDFRVLGKKVYKQTNEYYID